MSVAIHFGAGTTAWAEGTNSSLQSTLSSSSAGSSEVAVLPHHPITCRGELQFHDVGGLSCEHATAPPGERRTQVCVDESIAILLLELAREL
jgi:hypothetical protein